MSQNMLGVPAKTYAGPIADLRKKLRGKDGREWITAFKRFLRKENPWPETVFRGIDDLIASGKFVTRGEWICDKYAPQYIHTGRVVVEYLDLHLSTPNRAIEMMREMGYRPAQDPEVLRYNMEHPDQRVEGIPVVVIGAIWQCRDGYGRSLVLHPNSGERQWLDLVSWYDLPHPCRFAAVKIEEDIKQVQEAESFDHPITMAKPSQIR
ncbi:MAG: hypothetical protein NUV85_01400, partial [Candidatus Berkelbacteria bacterium]|nr:hypothetical protein [Candidatus Berkelbacteria bacterium]